MSCERRRANSRICRATTEESELKRVDTDNGLSEDECIGYVITGELQAAEAECYERPAGGQDRGGAGGEARRSEDAPLSGRERSLARSRESPQGCSRLG